MCEPTGVFYNAIPGAVLFICGGLLMMAGFVVSMVGIALDRGDGRWEKPAARFQKYAVAGGAVVGFIGMCWFCGAVMVDLGMLRF